MKKQNSANSPFLCGVKILMNKKIYARTLKLVNTTDKGELGGGMKQAMVYLQQYFNKPITEDLFIEMGSK